MGYMEKVSTLCCSFHRNGRYGGGNSGFFDEFCDGLSGDFTAAE